RDHRARFGLLQDADNLFFRKLLPLHLSVPSSGRTLASTGGENGGQVTRYPWRDICRAIDRPSQFSMAGNPAVESYGYRDLVETASPVDLGEAARRGTLESVERLAQVASSVINRTDAFGLTPLAWAVIYRRGDHAAALLKHGASPSGSSCQRLASPTSPMQFARALQWRKMIDQMRPYITKTPNVVLHDPPTLLSKPSYYELTRSIEFSRKRHAGKLENDASVIAKVSVDANGKAHDCELESKTGIKPLDHDICAQVLTGARWKAARGEYGEPVAGDGIIRLRIEAR
ncbi:MAG: ankyrin repeat domain-containing protein, partial [Alphaproteobacteria bacterium]|nr:ankyrin repeat domain-containing protein [Alphaproteobacteria bacterium]